MDVVRREGRQVQGPSRYIIIIPAWHNANSMGYNPKATGRPIESCGELLNKEWKGKVGLLNVPSIRHDGLRDGDRSPWS